MKRVVGIAAASAALAVAISLTAGPHAAGAAAETTIVETGSTLFFPLFQTWSGEYAKVAPSVRVTASGTGSGAGIKRATSGAAQIGASDAYMSDEELAAAPHMVNVPLAISAQTIDYNLPGVHAALKLDGPTIAGIYRGAIRAWDAPPIAALNPGISLPHHDIVPIHRSDASGDTFMFTQFLTFSTPAWDNGQGYASSVNADPAEVGGVGNAAGHGPGYGTTIAWPNVPGAVTATGNAGMVDAARARPYSIAYIGASFSDRIARAGLGTASLRNQAGVFLSATPKTVGAGAAMLGKRTPADERLSLVFAPGANSYPIVSYEYAIVSTVQPNAVTAAAIREFLLWALEPCDGGNPKNLAAVRFIGVPESIRALSIAQIEKVQ